MIKIQHIIYYSLWSRNGSHYYLLFKCTNLTKYAQQAEQILHYVFFVIDHLYSREIRVCILICKSIITNAFNQSKPPISTNSIYQRLIKCHTIFKNVWGYPKKEITCRNVIKLQRALFGLVLQHHDALHAPVHSSKPFILTTIIEGFGDLFVKMKELELSHASKTWIGICMMGSSS